MAHPMDISNGVTPSWLIMASFRFTEADERRSESGFQHAGSAAGAVMRLLRLVQGGVCNHHPRGAGSCKPPPVRDVYRRSRLSSCNPAVRLVELALCESGPARRLRPYSASRSRDSISPITSGPRISEPI